MQNPPRAEDRDELLREYQRSRERLLRAIDGLTDEQMTERTLDGWSICDHVAHITLWDELRASEVERISAGHRSLWRMTEQQDADLNAMGYDMRRSISPEQARWELATSRERLLAAIASATPEGLDASRYGEAGLRTGHEGMHAEWIERWRREKGY